MYGARKVAGAMLHREGQPWRGHGFCTVERLMADLRPLRSAVLVWQSQGNSAVPLSLVIILSRPADLVDRHFVASAPNQLWHMGSDITYVTTWSGLRPTSPQFIIVTWRSRDGSSAGWVSNTDSEPIWLSVLPWNRRFGRWPNRESRRFGPPLGTDGVQYRSPSDTRERGSLKKVPSPRSWSKGDSYDNDHRARMGWHRPSYKSELITTRSDTWRTVEDGGAGHPRSTGPRTGWN